MAQKPKLKCDIRPAFATAFKNWRQKKNFPLKNIAADLGVVYCHHQQMGTR